MHHMVIDLETLGLDPDAAILSIGAVVFNGDCFYDFRKAFATEMPCEFFPAFYCTVDLQSCLDLGLTVTAKTFHFWLKQSEEARSAIGDDQPGGSLLDVLSSLRIFCERYAVQVVWAHGSDFDISILKTAFRKVGMEPPWKYNAVRDCRTLFKIAPNYDPKKTGERIGVEHNALDDAKTDALAIMKILLALRHVGFCDFVRQKS